MAIPAQYTIELQTGDCPARIDELQRTLRAALPHLDDAGKASLRRYVGVRVKELVSGIQASAVERRSPHAPVV